MNLEHLSRRSFLKKTTVLTVGVASMSLFAGLVNAQTSAYYGRKTCVKVDVAQPGCQPYTNPSGQQNGYKCRVQCPADTTYYDAWCDTQYSSGISNFNSAICNL